MVKLGEEMKTFAAAIALSVTALAGPAAADTVIFKSSGLNVPYFSEHLDLTAIGRYKVEYTASTDIWTYATLSYRYHWDIFVAPFPTPHEEYLDGNDGDVKLSDGKYASKSTYYFDVFKPILYYFDADSRYEYRGVERGTLLYYYERPENITLDLGADNETNDELPPFDYSVKVTLLSVPEPTTWALLIMGFGAAGVTLRRRKVALAVR